MAQYRVNQVTYFGDKLYQPGELLTCPDDMMPGPHWKPVDPEAEAAAKAHGVKYTGEMPDVLMQLLPLYEDATAKANAAGGAIDVKGLVDAFKSALSQATDPEAAKAARAEEIAKAVAAAIEAGAPARRKAFDEAVAAAVAKELAKQLGGDAAPAAADASTAKPAAAAKK